VIRLTTGKPGAGMTFELPTVGGRSSQATPAPSGQLDLFGSPALRVSVQLLAPRGCPISLWHRVCGQPEALLAASFIGAYGCGQTL
jgi:hypothetical protein